MNLQGKTIWQIAAGNGNDTHYAKPCLNQDVIIIGPGRYGAWPDCRLPMLAENWTATKAGMTRRFAEDIKAGDIVVLRVGTQEVYGVGEVVGSYGWSEKFADTQGWDLQHYRRVRWLWKADPHPKTFPAYSLKFGSSVQYMISPVVTEWLASLNIPDDAYERKLTPL